MDEYNDPDDLFSEEKSQRVIESCCGWSQYVCKTCGGRAFHVWSAEYQTAISCVKCDVVASVHIG